MTRRLTLLSVHAHPDDESSKGAATVARYKDEGVRSVLVTCTGGEAGDILNPEMDRPEIAENLAAVRMAELEDAVKIIGYDTLHLLGYRDSGMPDTEANADPANFANAPFDEAVDRLARLIRLERPHVVITYGEDQSRYPHPDHLRVHDITAPAVERAADETWELDGDRPWQVQKVYWSNGFTRARLLAIHGWFIQHGQESPFEEWISKIPEDADDRVTTRVDVSGHLDVARDALRAHKTQVASDSFFFRVPVEELRGIHYWEEYELAWSLVGRGPADEHGFETDLFAGIPD